MLELVLQHRDFGLETETDFLLLVLDVQAPVCAFIRDGSIALTNLSEEPALLKLERVNMAHPDGLKERTVVEGSEAPDPAVQTGSCLWSPHPPNWGGGIVERLKSML